MRADSKSNAAETTAIMTGNRDAERDTCLS